MRDIHRDVVKARDGCPKTKYETGTTPAELTSATAAAHIPLRPRIWLAAALDVDERRNPESTVGNRRSDQQHASAVAEIAPPSSGGRDMLFLAQLGEPRG